MRSARLVLLVAMGLASAAVPSGGRLGAPAPPETHAAAPTIEPALPLRIDLTAADLQWSGDRGSARVEVSLVAEAGIRETRLDFEMPEGLSAEGEVPPANLPALTAGQSLRYVVPVRSARSGRFGVHVVADLRLDDGRSIRAGQGLDLSFGVPAPPCASNAGAYECSGVPLEESGK
jgi:hypothetical protein